MHKFRHFHYFNARSVMLTLPFKKIKKKAKGLAVNFKLWGTKVHFSIFIVNKEIISQIDAYMFQQQPRREKEKKSGVIIENPRKNRTKKEKAKV